MGLLLDHAGQIARKDRSSVDVVGAAIEAAEKLQPLLNAFTGIYAEEALEAARRADEEPPAARGPLHGVPIAVKDLYDVAGHVTSGCSKVFVDSAPATEDAPSVAALRAAGAIVIGKTNQHELAFGATNTNSCFGPAYNPWDTERMPGGSSGGSGAVVAARVVGAALGSDTGGSIRMPASFCGVTGLKTTWARLPLYGLMPMTPSFDTAGVLATDAADARAVFSTLERRSVGTKGETAPRYRIGVARDVWLDAVDPAVAASIDDAASVFRKAGHQVRDVAVPWIEPASHSWYGVALAEFARAYPTLNERRDDLDPAIAMILDAALGTTAEQERESRDGIVAARAAFDATMSDLDILVIAATPFPAPRHVDQTVEVNGTELMVHLGGPSRFTHAVNVVAAPALAVPSGENANGLPLGIQLVGRRGSEDLLLTAGEAYQRETVWHSRVPPLHA